MDSVWIALAVVIIVAAGLAYYYITQQPHTPSGGGDKPWTPVAPSHIDPKKPPPGIYLENPIFKPGMVWPDPASATCSGGWSYGLLTSLCPGSDPRFVNNGGLKCTNKANTEWTGCKQATKPYSKFGQ